MKRITKILMLTFIFTMFITSTCLAASSYSSDTIAEIKDYVRQNYGSNVYYVICYNTDTNPIVAVSSSRLVGKTTAHSSGTLIDFLNVTKVTLYLDSDGHLYGVPAVQENTTYQNFMSNIVFSTHDVYDSYDSIIYDSPNEEEPDIPDMPSALPSTPITDYSYNYSFIYTNNNGSTCLALFSSNDPITFSAITKEDVAYIDFTFTSAMNYSNYVLRDEAWTRLVNVNYTDADAGTKDVNIAYTSIISTPFNILNEDGTIFFPQTPLLTEITGEALPEMWVTIMKAVLVIVILAVSCLALLILLQVLLKVLRTYLTY